MGKLRRLGISVAFGLAVLEAVAAVGLAALGRWDLGWVAALVTHALATYAFGVALIRTQGPPRRAAGAVPPPDARLARVAQRRRERWAASGRQATAAHPGAAPAPSPQVEGSASRVPAQGFWRRVGRVFGGGDGVGDVGRGAMPTEDREVTAPCPRCGQPFVLLVGPAGGGHDVDVVGWACDCDLTEDEYEDLCDRAVAAFEVGQGTPPPPAPRPWWRRLIGGE